MSDSSEEDFKAIKFRVDPLEGSFEPFVLHLEVRDCTQLRELAKAFGSMPWGSGGGVYQFLKRKMEQAGRP